MRHTLDGSKGKEGTALLAALLVVMTVGALSATTIQLQMSSLRQQETANDRKRAFYLAEAGLSEALLSLREGGLGQVGTKALPASFGGGYLYTSAVEDAHGNFLIRSTGIADRARQRLGLAVERQVLSPGSLGFFGADSLDIGGGTQLTYVDSVDADEKTDREGAVAAGDAVPFPGVPVDDEYRGTVYPDALGPRFGSNVMIHVGNVGAGPLTTLQADVIRGPGAILDIDLGATVTGATAAGAEDAALPELAWPGFLAGGNVDVPTGLAEPFILDETHHPAVTVGATGTLRIVGPLRISVDTLFLAPGGILEIDSTNGPVELHVAQQLDFSAGSAMQSVDANAGGLTLVVHGDDSVVPAVQMGAVGTFHGVLYAPLAAVQLPKGLTWTGSVVGRTLVVPEDSTLIFDSAVLSDVAAQISHVPVSWNLLPVPKDVANTRTYQPDASYQALGIAALFPADAIQIADQVIAYVGVDGQEYIYRGRAGALEPEDVASTLETINDVDPSFPDEVQPDGVFVQL